MSSHVRVTGLMVGLLLCLSVTVQAADSFGIDDYFRLRRVSELALSPDGKNVVYVTTGISEQRDSRTYFWSQGAKESSVEVEVLADARQLAWIPLSREIAFLSARDGVSQLYAYDIGSTKVRQITRSADAVERFRFTADGTSFAYVTRQPVEPGTTFYQLMLTGERGMVADTNSLSVYNFIDPTRGSEEIPPPAQLWISRASGEQVRVPVPADPRTRTGDFFWSSDGAMLSVSYISASLPTSLLGRYNRTSLGVYDVGSGKFQVLGEASNPTADRPGLTFTGGEWIPGQHRLLARRVTETDPWVSDSFPQWAVVSADTRLSDVADWNAEVEVYGSTHRFTPLGEKEFLLETTGSAVRSLYTLNARGVLRTPLVAGVTGSASMFSFSADRRSVAFVNESFTRPPEIYLRSGRQPPRKLTRLNEEIAQRLRFTVEEVSWPGANGVITQGWLMKPASDAGKPWPLLTHVHGGPSFAVSDTFAPYLALWPYPFEVMAANGTAVFLPNYRGTQSFGRAFATPTQNDDEPPIDVLKGVASMIERGIADPKRLGISGHSHGAWLGPVVFTRARDVSFCAASFAEGSADKIINYALMSGDLNRQVHDALMGVSLYDDPQRYLDGSPDMHFKGLAGAVLFEAGSRNSSISMMGSVKAARYAGLPTEYIIYPQSGHNLSRAPIQKESAVRNLDWFEYWLNGRTDGDPAKAAQYQRWDALRTARGGARCGGKSGG